MIDGSNFSAVIQSKKVPVISEALEFATMGLIPAGAYKNREFRETMVTISSAIDRAVQDVLFDPQTSGGLLMSVEPKRADQLVGDLIVNGFTETKIIGQVIAEPQGRIIVE